MAVHQAPVLTLPPRGGNKRTLGDASVGPLSAVAATTPEILVNSAVEPRLTPEQGRFLRNMSSRVPEGTFGRDSDSLDFEVAEPKMFVGFILA
jgi:hypothetical protein